LWSTVDKKKALDKTRQALREGAPDLLRGIEGKDVSDISTSTPRAKEHVVEQSCSLRDFNPFVSAQTQGRPEGHLRFLSDASIDITSLLNDPMDTSEGTRTLPQNTKNYNAPPSANNHQNQVQSAGNVQNQVCSGEELSEMLRTAQMNLIQRHISEWQQISNMRASMQSTGYGDAQLQLQALQIQMQLQNAWSQSFQGGSGGVSQQQTFQPNAVNPPTQAAANTYNAQTTHATSQSFPNVHQGTARSENSQDISTMLTAIQNNANTNQINTNHSTNYSNTNQSTDYQAATLSQGPASSENVDFSSLFSFAALQNNSSNLNESYGQTTSSSNNAPLSLLQQMQSQLMNQQSLTQKTDNSTGNFFKRSPIDISNRTPVAKSA
jgi:hypothetical protein